MHSLKFNDPIDVLEFNNKINRILIDCNIKDIDAFMSTQINNISGIATLKNTDIKKITQVYAELNKNRKSIYNNAFTQKNIYKSFTDSDGIEYTDVNIYNLNLSKITILNLSTNKIMYYSQIIDLTYNDLKIINNLDEESINEILNISKTVKLKPFYRYRELLNIQNSIFINLFSKTNINYKLLMHSIKDIIKDFNQNYKRQNIDSNLLENKTFIDKLSNDYYIKNSLTNYVFSIVDQFTYGCDESMILESMPIPFNKITIVNKIINELLNNKKIDILSNDNYVTVYENFFNIIKYYLNNREFEILEYRINGKTLEEVGLIYNITRERVRQIESKSLKKITLLDLHFSFDYYTKMFMKYNISKKDFMFTFKDLQAYSYLKMRYGSTKKGSQKKEFSEILKDKEIPIKIRKKCEKTIYKNYFYIDSKYIKCGRQELVNYTLSTFCTQTISIKGFKEFYSMLLIDLNIENILKYSIEGKGYINYLRDSNKVLWSLKERLRYYNIKSYDINNFLDELNLNSYHNIEFSTLKIFNKHNDLMKEYNILDEYELHNLLKKICSKEKYPLLKFSRMPNLQFGESNREQQVENLLYKIAPIEYNKFAIEYENEYGVLAQTVKANYLSGIYKYLNNGVYRLDYPNLPKQILNYMNTIFTKDIYFYNEIDTIKFDNKEIINEKYFNSYSYICLGYKLFSNLILKETFSTTSDYCEYIINKESIFFLYSINENLRHSISFNNILNKKKNEYDIIEFNKNKYLNINKMNEYAPSKNDILNYCLNVISFVKNIKYFTIYSINKLGFYDELEKFGFDSYFYNSLLIQQKKSLSYLKINHTALFRTESDKFNLIDFIEDIVYSDENLSMDVFELSSFIENEYNLKIDEHKIIQVIEESKMYYSEITEKIYADYYIYLEEI